MKKILFAFLWIVSICTSLFAQNKIDSLIPVRGLSVAAPLPDRLEEFIGFIENELVPMGINTLILRVDFNYQYTSYPNLRDSIALSKTDVKKLVEITKKHNIEIIPQINLLGHQSWASETYNLLRVYPEFDETPWVKMPKNYEWPNTDNLYCKSYCPLHPQVHLVVFALVDEIVDVFEAKAFHAGMDEVFYLGEEKCTRCSGKDKAKLFANEVTLIHDHLAKRSKTLWIWGDRLLDGEQNGLGMWEASMNQTSQAIDLIPKDIVICDWHYDRAEPTAAYFALKGFKVLSCSWNKSEVAQAQLNQLLLLKKDANTIISNNLLGMMHTIWSPAGSFLDQYYGKTKTLENSGPSDCFKSLFSEINKLSE